LSAMRLLIAAIYAESSLEYGSYKNSLVPPSIGCLSRFPGFSRNLLI
jgi:hypothetical protein